MQLSVLLSALALSAAGVSARRDLRHVAPVAERLQTRKPEPRIQNEYAAEIKRTTSSSGYQYLTNSTQGKDKVKRKHKEKRLGEKMVGNR